MTATPPHAHVPPAADQDPVAALSALAFGVAGVAAYGTLVADYGYGNGPFGSSSLVTGLYVLVSVGSIGAGAVLLRNAAVAHGAGLLLGGGAMLLEPPALSAMFLAEFDDLSERGAGLVIMAIGGLATIITGASALPRRRGSRVTASRTALTVGALLAAAAFLVDTDDGPVYIPDGGWAKAQLAVSVLAFSLPVLVMLRDARVSAAAALPLGLTSMIGAYDVWDRFGSGADVVLAAAGGALLAGTAVLRFAADRR